jgi:lipopolysaccharide export system permease protein
MHFDEWDKVFDLSGFKFTRTNEDMFKNATQMMNVAQLSESIDSLKKQKNRSSLNMQSLLVPHMTLETRGLEKDKIMAAMNNKAYQPRKYDSSLMELVADSSKKALTQALVNNVRNLKSLMDVTALDNRLQIENYLKYEIELHKKFTLSFACILLFLIGAPLGAIIRKGGLGMPLVIAVSFFVTFHILNISGEKLAKAASVAPWMGMWMSTFMLLPLAIWLIRAARNDSSIFRAEAYLRFFRILARVMSAVSK